MLGGSRCCVAFFGNPPESRSALSQESNGDGAALSAAIVVWKGSGADYWPLLDDRRIVDRYGREAASDLLPKLRALKEEFYASDAWKRAKDLREMQELSAAEFRLRHPELTDQAISAFALCYTFDYK
jgi:hypothetical protein